MAIRTKQGGRRGSKDYPSHVAAQARGTLSVKEYCRRHGLSVWSFYNHRRRTRPSLEPAPLSFTEFALPSTSSASLVSIHFPNGMRLEIPATLAGLDVTSLAEVLARRASAC